MTTNTSGGRRFIPRHRSHQGWIDTMRHDPSVNLHMRDLLTQIVEYGTWQDKRGNRYGITRAKLATILGISERATQKRIAAARKAGWLIVCEPGSKGHQQVYHRSHPADPVRYWTPHPCPICHGHDRTRGTAVTNED